MGLIVKNFELPDHTILDDAYLKIESVKISNRDYEFFENIAGTDDQILKWITKITSEATAIIWSDKEARSNRAYSLNWFSFSFEYDLSIHENVYEQAYRKLKQIYPEGVDD